VIPAKETAVKAVNKQKKARNWRTKILRILIDRSTKPAKNYFVTVVQEKEGVSKREKERGCCVSGVNGAATSNSIGSDPTSNLPLRRARFENGSSH
jgi:hypothetical protein